MASANEELMNQQIGHAVDLRRYSDSVVNRMIAVLNRSDSAMAAELAAKLIDMDATTFSMERLEGMLYSVRALNRDAYNQVERELTAELRDFSQYESAYQQSMIASVVPVQISVVGVSVEQVASAALSRPFQGNLLRGFFADMEAKKAKIIRQTIADGYVQGKTTGDIVRSIRGTKAKGYSDGVIEITRRDAQAVVRTALSHTAATAKQSVLDANQDIMKGYMWLATLDLRTSSPCRARDHKKYDLKFKPIGHSFPWGAGPGKFHWNCRSANTPILKSLKEITGLDIADFTPTERASMDGQVPADTDYGKWLKAQSAARQDDALGPKFGALFRKDNLSVDDLYSAKGVSLTLSELLKRSQDSAFAKLGL